MYRILLFLSICGLITLNGCKKEDNFFKPPDPLVGFWNVDSLNYTYTTGTNWSPSNSSSCKAYSAGWISFSPDHKVQMVANLDCLNNNEMDTLIGYWRRASNYLLFGFDDYSEYYIDSLTSDIMEVRYSYSEYTKEWYWRKKRNIYLSK